MGMAEAELRWIEQAESRRILAQVTSERTASQTWARLEARTAPQCLPRLGEWLAAHRPVGRETPKPQQSAVRRASRCPFR
jgi:hypothetical protein